MDIRKELVRVAKMIEADVVVPTEFDRNVGLMQDEASAVGGAIENWAGAMGRITNDFGGDLEVINGSVYKTADKLSSEINDLVDKIDEKLESNYDDPQMYFSAIMVDLTSIRSLMQTCKEYANEHTKTVIELMRSAEMVFEPDSSKFDNVFKQVNEFKSWIDDGFARYDRYYAEAWKAVKRTGYFGRNASIRRKADDSVFVIIDEDGAKEVGEGNFHKVMASCQLSITASEGGVEDDPEPVPIWDDEDKARDRKFRSVGHKWTIYVSPKVNAINESEAKPGLLDFPRKVKNFLSTALNKIRHEDIIDGVINEHDLYGYTIEKGKGRYPYKDKETGKRKVSVEDSYIITIYCFEPRSVAFKIGEELRDRFKQESVIVDVGRGGQSV